MKKALLIAMLVMMGGCATQPKWDYTDATQFKADREYCEGQSWLKIHSPRTTARTTCSETMGCRTTFSTQHYRRFYSDEVFQSCMEHTKGYTPLGETK